MKHFISTAVAASLALTIAAQGQQKQKPGTPPPAQTTTQNGTPIIKVNTNEVNLVFTAVDHHNRFITGLRQDQIEVLDDDHPQKITRFVQQGDVPLHIALLLDTSNSIRDRWDFEQQAAIDFLQQILRVGTDEAMVVAFDAEPHTVVDFTDDMNKISEGIHKLRPGGGTALWDALVYAARDKMQPSADIARDVVVIISDGEDDQSRFSGSEALALAESAGAVIFTVSTEPYGTDAKDDDLMKNMADQTGGRSFFPAQTSDLPSAFSSIITEMRNEYVVSYQPNDLVANGAFHPVKVKVLIRDVQARSRKGYYAPDAPSTSPSKP